ncbi:hypothetical protein P43SY_000213 [Pythium insidiosum]|uniref:Mechanosensitive ion channel MscS domain-containing protein n=1 Tax=Pythium insidiosum TaxID=114742 RepID=A0AAD5LSI2_PYTIN|nr:hypothetical protein P43SY_000213 [Pythium insidiosum]
MELWRIGLAALVVAAAYLLTEPLLHKVFHAIRRRLGKRFRWVGDLQRFVVTYLAWLCITLVILVAAENILQIKSNSDAIKGIFYLMAVPIVLGTLALRKVVTNMIVRHFQWDRKSKEYDVKIFVVTETMKVLCGCLVIVEVFYIFFLKNKLAGFLVVELLLGIEAIMILSSYTVLKNVSTGLFLIFAEPFRSGSYCRILNLRGIIERVSLARTTMRREDGSLVFIPNGVFAAYEQTNFDPSDACEHTTTIRLHPWFTVRQTKLLLLDLQETCLEFAADRPAEQVFPGSAPSFSRPGRLSIQASAASAGASAMEAERLGAHDKALAISLDRLHTIKVWLVIDAQHVDASADAARTEVSSNLSTHELALLF